MVAALDRGCPGIGELAGPLLGPPAPSSFEGLVTALINKLAAQPGEDEVLLVLDDYQLIDAEQVRTTLAFRLERLPAALHPALASRSDPPGWWARRAPGPRCRYRRSNLVAGQRDFKILLATVWSWPDTWLLRSGHRSSRGSHRNFGLAPHRSRSWRHRRAPAPAPAALPCQRTDCGKFHRSVHRRVMPHGAARP